MFRKLNSQCIVLAKLKSCDKIGLLHQSSSAHPPLACTWDTRMGECLIWFTFSSRRQHLLNTLQRILTEFRGRKAEQKRRCYLTAKDTASGVQSTISTGACTVLQTRILSIKLPYPDRKLVV